MTAEVRSLSGVLSPGALLRLAIRERRLVSFKLHGFSRRAEPHDYGVIDGGRRLFFYQVGGGSRSGTPIGWRWAPLADISELLLLDVRFPGSRDTGSARHVKWDRLLASVSREVEDTEDEE
jgi:hypothetical protein